MGKTFTLKDVCKLVEGLGLTPDEVHFNCDARVYLIKNIDERTDISIYIEGVNGHVFADIVTSPEKWETPDDDCRYEELYEGPIWDFIEKEAR